MKKMILLGFVSFLLLSCGKEYETYTYMQKQKMYKEAVEDPQKMEKIQTLMELLKKEAESGDATAEKEYKDWRTIESLAPSLPKPTEKANLMDLKW